MIIPVVGAVAAGKTTFSTALGSKLGIPVLRIDDHHRDASEIYSCPGAWADLIEQMRDTPEPYIVESSATPDVYLDELDGHECFSVRVECSREVRHQRLIDRGYAPELINNLIETGNHPGRRLHVDVSVDGALKSWEASEAAHRIALQVAEGLGCSRCGGPPSSCYLCQARRRREVASGSGKLEAGKEFERCLGRRDRERDGRVRSVRRQLGWGWDIRYLSRRHQLPRFLILLAAADIWWSRRGLRPACISWEEMNKRPAH